MYLELILPTALTLILFGLTKSTESVLDIRQKRRDQGNDTKTYL
jgi:regulator of PEP synthase PpsR (kinase-PPPase family)